MDRPLRPRGTQRSLTRSHRRNAALERRYVDIDQLTGATGPGLADTILSFEPGGLWKLDETSGLTAFDSSGNGNDLGIAAGVAPTWGGAAGPPGTVAPTFSLGDTIGTGTPTYLPSYTGDFTVLGWFLRSSPVSTGFDALAYAKGTHTGWELGVNGPSFDTGNHASLIVGTGSADAFIESDNALTDSTWYMLAVVHTGTTWKLYVDGAVQTTTYTGAYSAVATDFKIGSFSGTGQASWVMFKQAALTDGDILAIYQSLTPAVPDGYVYSADGAGSVKWRQVKGTGDTTVTVNSGDITIDSSGGGGGTPDGVTLDTNGSGELEVKAGGIGMTQLASTGAADGKWMRDSSGALVWDSIDAVDVAIADSGGYFTSTDVEGALQELGGRSSLTVGTSDPASPTAGTEYLNTSTGKLCVYDGTSWWRVSIVQDPNSNSYANAVNALTPIAFWLLNEASGTTNLDQAAGAHNLTITGTVSAYQASIGTHAGLQKGIYYSNTSFGRNAASIGDVVSNKFSIAGWFQYVAFPGGFVPLVCASVSGGHVSPYYSFYMGANSANQWRLWVSTAGVANTFDTGIALPTVGTWFFAAMTYDGASLKLYKDSSTAIYSTSLTGNVNAMGSFGLNVIPALNSTAYSSNAKYGSVAYWNNYTLTTTDIANLISAAN